MHDAPPYRPASYSEQMLRAILDHSDEGITLVNEYGLIVEWNQKLSEITGVPRQAAVGQAIWDVQFQLIPSEKTTAEFYEQIRQTTRRMLNTGERPTRLLSETIVQRADGSTRLVQDMPLPVETGNGFMIVGTVRDITEQRRIEEELRQTERRYHTWFEQANDAIFIENEQDEIIDVNQQACQLLGYTRAELLRLKVPDLQVPEVRGEAGRVITGELQKHGNQPFEGLNLRRDGTRIPVEVTVTRLTGNDQRLVLTIVRDITARKQIERALRESEEQFRLAFSAAATGKTLVSVEGRFLQVNAALCQMLGYTEAELLSRSFNDITLPEDKSLGLDYFRRVLAGEMDTVSFEKRYLRKDGTPLWTIVSSSIIRDEHGQPRHFISEIQDINERKLAETALHDSEEKYRQLFELESDALFLIDNVSGRILEANAAAVALYGYTRDDLLQMKNTDLSAEPDRTRQTVKDQRTLILTRWHRKHDGRIFPVEITGRYLTWHGRPVHIAAMRDITERLRAEQAIVESEQRYRALFETSPDAIILVNPDGGIRVCNQRAADILGLARREDLIGRSLFDIVRPADRLRAQTEFAQLLQTGLMRDVEYMAQTVSGLNFSVEINSSVMYDAERQPATVIAIVRDITDRKRAEALLQQQNRDLAELNSELQLRNEDLDAFAHTAAHNLKNPLQLLVGFAEAFLDPDYRSSEDIAVALTHIARSGRKMNNIIDELLLLAEVRKTQVKMQPVDVAQTLVDARQRLQDLLSDTQAEISAPATWPTVLGHAPWLEEIWVNYLGNAVKYGGRPPRIEVGSDILPDSAVRFWVRDNGDGIAPDVQARLFTPFTRLDQVRARGHGLGLSIVRRIVEKMGGQVGMTSSGLPGQGSLFYFTLPTHEGDS